MPRKYPTRHTSRTSRRTTRRRKTYPRKKKRGPKKGKHRYSMVSLPRQIIPRRGFAVHECIRYIRIPQRITNTDPLPTPVVANWQMPNWGAPTGQEELPFNTLFISCNDPMAPFNEVGVPNTLQPGSFDENWPSPDTPAFLCNINAVGDRTAASQALFDTAPLTGSTVPPGGGPSGYRNFYGSHWQKMKAFYTKFTVVGSKATISFHPDAVYSVDYARQEAKHCMFTCGVVASRNGGLYEDASSQQALTEQPGFITREYHGRSQQTSNRAAFSMTRKWSAKRNMGLSKGNIVGNNAITGESTAPYSQYPHGLDAPNQWSVVPNSTLQQEVTSSFAQHPAQQNWFAFSGNSMLTNNTVGGAYEKAEWPSGLLKIKIRYATVWSDPRYANNEQI